mgnify:CR=1 FL=1
MEVALNALLTKFSAAARRPEALSSMRVISASRLWRIFAKVSESFTDSPSIISRRDAEVRGVSVSLGISKEAGSFGRFDLLVDKIASIFCWMSISLRRGAERSGERISKRSVDCVKTAQNEVIFECDFKF